MSTTNAATINGSDAAEGDGINTNAGGDFGGLGPGRHRVAISVLVRRARGDAEERGRFFGGDPPRVEPLANGEGNRFPHRNLFYFGHGLDSEYGIRISKENYSGFGFTDTMNDVETFASFFKARFRERTTREFAAETGSSQSAISKALNGRAPCPEGHEGPWARALGLSATDTKRFLALAKDSRVLSKTSGERYEEVMAAMRKRDALMLEVVIRLQQRGKKLPKDVLLHLQELEKLLRVE